MFQKKWLTRYAALYLAVAIAGALLLYLTGLLPQDRVPEVYSLGDVALILGKKGIGSSGVPSKTWTIMACGTPIIAAVDTESELAQTICGAEAGICLEPGDPEALAAAITAMQTQRERYAGGRAYVCDHASKATAICRYLEILAP